MTGLTPTSVAENVTIEHVETLINDSVRLQYPWRKWALVGGEPTTHPNLCAILDRIADYRQDYKPRLIVLLATHGYGDAVQEVLRQLFVQFPFLVIRDTHKCGPSQPDFVATCVAPEDIDSTWVDSHRFTGCLVSSYCGIGMNYRGFYPCAVAGAIDRIFGFHREIPSLEEVTRETMMDRYQTFCRLCGHYRPIYENSQTLLSPSWRAALERKPNHGH